MTTVLHVFGAMDVGGAEMRTLDLVRDLAPEGVEFHFLTLSGRRGVLADEIESLGGHVHPVRLGPKFPVGYLRLLRRLQPDVVDSHVATFSGALLLGAALARVPVRIAHFRSDGDGHANTVRRRLQRRVMRALIHSCATAIVGVSPSALRDGYSGAWEADRRARVIVNGVRVSDEQGTDLRSELGIGPEPTVILHVGRPSPEKNRTRAVSVVAALQDTGHDVHLAFVGGEGVDSADVAAATDRAGLEGRVHHLGSRRDAHSLMRQADVVILPSIREGLPGVVLESLAVGTPVVASDLPGVRFIAEQVPGVNAVGLDQADAVWADVVAACVRASDGGDRRAEVRAGFAASAFSQKTASEVHHRLYRGES
ncbi:glycosyltransferase [Intrasporangium flavum]|uniref:glycosyltransferase n=1 Tax=Intrasporangium flavum TaxID=1428657 RepID=UPI00096DC07E|nr:glycosyltransferase [Intrasporangium flavum]